MSVVPMVRDTSFARPHHDVLILFGVTLRNERSESLEGCLEELRNQPES